LQNRSTPIQLQFYEIDFSRSAVALINLGGTSFKMSSDNGNDRKVRLNERGSSSLRACGSAGSLSTLASETQGRITLASGE